ncbi:MAG TPA: Gfo/Idh/MocA family oxidoreductase [Syntrophorhabdaceae bacterium]|nr:Gfo/Idh/MocA family oxidoreductase [Syntrophorhabdaceae bacterium]
MIGIGVIGFGYWGPNLVRNFSELQKSKVLAICDARPERLKSAQLRYPGVETTNDFRELMDHKGIDAIAIATPVSSHYELAMESLKAGKHVLVEKPLTMTSEQGIRLIDEAEKRSLTLMVDHTFLYTGAVRKIKDLVDTNGVGEVYYYDSVRVNLGLFQHDVNVIWDLAVHDLSIMDYVLGMEPVAVSATGISHVTGKPEDIAYLTLFFDSRVIAHIHVNWLAPVKVRSTLIGGDKKMIVYDDLEPSEKIKIYDKGITLGNNGEGIYKEMIGYRTGDMWAPKLDTAEALKLEAVHFLQCIEEKKKPVTDGAAGLRIVKILEAATESMKEHGRPLELYKGRVAA